MSLCIFIKPMNEYWSIFTSSSIISRVVCGGYTIHIKDGACEHIHTEMTEMEVDTTRTLELCYEFDGDHSIPVTFYPNTMIGKLIDYMKNVVNSSDIAFYYGDVKLDGDKTMRDYNIPTGAKLTVKKFFTLPPSSPSPEPEDMQKDPMHSPSAAPEIDAG